MSPDDGIPRTRTAAIRPVHKTWRQDEMFKKILIANRGARAEGAVAPATNCLSTGIAGWAGEFTPGGCCV